MSVDACPHCGAQGTVTPHAWITDRALYWYTCGTRYFTQGGEVDSRVIRGEQCEEDDDADVTD